MKSEKDDYNSNHLIRTTGFQWMPLVLVLLVPVIMFLLSWLAIDTMITCSMNLSSINMLQSSAKAKIEQVLLTTRNSHQRVRFHHEEQHEDHDHGHNEGDYVKSSSSDDNLLIPKRFYLKQHNLNLLEQRLYEISDPDHIDYGRWLTIDELTTYLTTPLATEKTNNDNRWSSTSSSSESKSSAPTTHTEEIEKVLHWLKDSRALLSSDESLLSTSSSPEEEYQISPTKDNILVTWNIKTIEAVFDAKVETPYPGQRTSFRPSMPQLYMTSEITMPKELSSIVDLITIGSSMMTSSTKRYQQKYSKDNSYSRGTPLQSEFEGQNITPNKIYELYNLSMMTGLDDPNQDILVSQSVAEFEEAYFYPNDVVQFEQQNHLPLQNITKIIGNNTPDEGYLGEASLDVQYIIAAAPTVPTFVISLYEFDLGNYVEEILKLNQDDDIAIKPRVHSISWGSAEMDYKPEWIDRMNMELMKLALLGYTILVASGDEGAGNSAEFGLRCKKFQPVFPATSPFVTAVGGTYVDEKTNQEIGWKYSGGGFSDHFARPAYQDDVVKGYFEDLAANGLLPPQTKYNSTGRAVPDISAVATNYQVVIEKSTGPMSGTSASTPTIAGFISRLNQQRLLHGQPVLGFLNPLMYKKLYKGFNDICQGSNKPRPCRTGWSARVGWDAITGFGTPNLGELLDLAISSTVERDD